MRFLKDRECKNGTNHSTDDAGDCRAKVPILIPSNIKKWKSFCWIILLCICGILIVLLENTFYRGISCAILAIIMSLAISTVFADSGWGFYRRFFAKVIHTVLCGGIHPPLKTIIFIVILSMGFITGEL